MERVEKNGWALCIVPRAARGLVRCFCHLRDNWNEGPAHPGFASIDYLRMPVGQAFPIWRCVMSLCRIAAVAIAWLCPLSFSLAADSLPAFPGAEGFGSTTPGGRGGAVLLVTNLEDYLPKEQPIPGSLRAALSAKWPRIVVFRVSGTIPLKAAVKITEPYLTVAGQSAPGDGICLKNQTVSINTHDVVLRHLRVRPGDELGAEYKKLGKSFAPDGISVGTPSKNVVIDHCSVSWAIDETLSVSGEGITDVTAQWCIISESLNNSLHDKGQHGYGSLLRTNGNVTFHHNLYAHHSSRAPRPGTYGDGSILLDFRNNVIHDSVGYSAKDAVRMNYVGNFIKRPRKKYAFQIGGETTKLFVEGNQLADAGNKSDDPWALISGGKAENRMEKPFPTAKVTTESALEAYQAVLKSAGATRPYRDAVDLRVIEQLENGTGGLIDSQTEVGGYPEVRTKDVPQDQDQDGMPDDWEKKHELDPASAKDASSDQDGDGYTNIEEYLNETDPTAS